MKKIFTLLLATGIVAIASAQARDFDHNKDFDHGKQAYGYSVNAKQAAIQDINRSYDYKIAGIRQNRWMNRWEKTKQISQLERQRDEEIARLQFRFQNDNKRFSDHGYADDRKHRW